MTKAKSVLIIGSHPIAEDLTRQYAALNYIIRHQPEMQGCDVDINDCDELCLLTSPTQEAKLAADNQAIGRLADLASRLDVATHGGQRVRCHLLLQSRTSLRLLQEIDFCDAVRQKIDVYPFTLNDVWSRTIVLDYEPITLQTNRTAHLVVFGTGEMAEAVMINAAQIAHYPNFTREPRLRTRITVIDEHASAECEKWIQRYKSLFDNSYYRIIKPNTEQVVSSFHQPDYLQRGTKDFVDVEWEFVEASLYDDMIREKLALWCTDKSRQLLTIVVAHDDQEQNLDEALHLPDCVYASDIPIHVCAHYDTLIRQLSTTKPGLRPFGMLDRGYDVRMPAVQMAKRVNYIYNLCYRDNVENWTGQIRCSVEIDKEVCEAMWQNVKAVKRMSNIYNAMSVATKMRSIGLSDNEWDKFYDIPRQDIELLAEVEHNRWSVEELILGWRPCTAEEQSMVEADISQKEELKKRKIHYDLRPYHDLRTDATGKPVALYDLCLCSCLPLITKSFADEEGGEYGY